VSNVFSDSELSDQPISTGDPKGSLSIPISFFENVEDTWAKGFYGNMNNTVAWRDFCEMFAELAEQPFASKEAAPLYSPTIYQRVKRTKANGNPYKGYRNELNATKSALVVIDADKGFDIEAAERFLTERKIEAILHTTAQNQDGTRFRVIVPLMEPVDPETHKSVVYAVCAFLKPGWKPDTSKNNCYSLFYVPGRYAGADNRFVHIVGSIFPTKAWLQLGGQSLANGCSETESKKEAVPITTTWNSSFDCPYVDQQWVNEYLDLTDGFYNGLSSSSAGSRSRRCAKGSS